MRSWSTCPRVEQSLPQMLASGRVNPPARPDPAGGVVPTALQILCYHFEVLLDAGRARAREAPDAAFTAIDNFRVVP
jgi:hypothetical protein